MNQAATGRRHQVSERDQAETELRTTQALPLAPQRRLAALAVAPCAARTDQGRPLECAHQRSSAAAHSLLTLFVSAIARRRLRLRVCVLGIVCDVGRTNEARQVRRRRSMRADTRSVGSRAAGKKSPSLALATAAVRDPRAAPLPRHAQGEHRYIIASSTTRGRAGFRGTCGAAESACAVLSAFCLRAHLPAEPASLLEDGSGGLRDTQHHGARDDPGRLRAEREVRGFLQSHICLIIRPSYCQTA